MDKSALEFEYSITYEELENYFKINEGIFLPPLSDRLNLEVYLNKLIKQASFIVGRYQNKRIVGILAFYMNDFEKKSAFITSFSIVKEFQGKGYSKRFLKELYQLMKDSKFEKIALEVYQKNPVAISLYSKEGFEVSEYKNRSQIMVKYV